MSRNAWADDLLEYHLTRTKEKTSRQYAYDLRVLGRFLREHRGVAAADNAAVVEHLIGPCRDGRPAATRMLLRAFTAWALQTGRSDGGGYSQSQVRRMQSSIRSLMVAAYEDLGIIDYRHRVMPPLIDHGPPRRNVRGPGRDVVMAMIHTCQTWPGCKGRRDELACWLMFANALRVGEVCSIEYPRGVDLQAGSVWVTPKGHHDREEIELPRQTLAALNAYLDERGDTPGPLLLSMHRGRDGEGITTDGMRDVVAKLGDAVAAHVRPHKLRHAGITEITRLTNANDLWVSILSRHRIYRGRGRMWQRYQDDPVYTMREAAEIVQRGRPWVHPSAR